MFSKISKVYNTTNPRLPLQTPVVKIVKEKNKAIKYTKKNKKSKLALIVPKIARKEKNYLKHLWKQLLQSRAARSPGSE
jgi:hypothetical protein